MPAPVVPQLPRVSEPDIDKVMSGFHYASSPTEAKAALLKCQEVLTNDTENRGIAVVCSSHFKGASEVLLENDKGLVRPYFAATVGRIALPTATKGVHSLDRRDPSTDHSRVVYFMAPAAHVAPEIWKLLTGPKAPCLDLMRGFCRRFTTAAVPSLKLVNDQMWDVRWFPGRLELAVRVPVRVATDLLRASGTQGFFVREARPIIGTSRYPLVRLHRGVTLAEGLHMTKTLGSSAVGLTCTGGLSIRAVSKEVHAALRASLGSSAASYNMDPQYVITGGLFEELKEDLLADLRAAGWLSISQVGRCWYARGYRSVVVHASAPPAFSCLCRTGRSTLSVRLWEPTDGRPRPAGKVFRPGTATLAKVRLPPLMPSQPPPPPTTPPLPAQQVPAVIPPAATPSSQTKQKEALDSTKAPSWGRDLFKRFALPFSPGKQEAEGSSDDEDAPMADGITPCNHKWSSGWKISSATTCGICSAPVQRQRTMKDCTACSMRACTSCARS